jgi:hypothetical protein
MTIKNASFRQEGKQLTVMRFEVVGITFFELASNWEKFSGRCKLPDTFL